MMVFVLGLWEFVHLEIGWRSIVSLNVASWVGVYQLQMSEVEVYIYVLVYIDTIDLSYSYAQQGHGGFLSRVRLWEFRL